MNTPNIQSIINSVGTSKNSEEMAVAASFFMKAHKAHEKDQAGIPLDASERQALFDLQTIQAELNGELD